ncbi:TPA: type I toxin-antitoxin system Hok family toxin [Escherichia coli]|nr:type I toxin-antitoxin system Hok family toxin [Escherichia coli]
MLDTCRLASYVPKGKEKQAMKQQKAMLIALIVICLTVIVTALVTRKDLCEVRIRTGHPNHSSNLLIKTCQHG